jgi:hypothetical protein
MTYEKRIDALREVYEATCTYYNDLNAFIIDMTTIDDDNERAEHIKDYASITIAFEDKYNKNRVYVPKHIDAWYEECRMIVDQALAPYRVNQAIRTGDSLLIDKGMEKQYEYLNRILEEIRKLLGL